MTTVAINIDSLKKQLRGNWINSGDEKLILTPTDNNLLIGRFEKLLDPEKGKEQFEIIGYYQENFLSFMVDLSDYGFSISWIGNLKNETPDSVIEAQWTIMQNATARSNSKKYCDGFFSGKKYFKKVR